MNIKTGLRSGYPGGSYQESCEIIGYNPNSRILQANCDQINGMPNHSSMVVPEEYEDIVNCDGILAIDYCL